MKLTSGLFILLAFLSFSFASCESEEQEKETVYDNEALFDEIQNSLQTRKISLEEYSEMTSNVHGTPDFFRESGDLTYEEFLSNNANLSNSDLHKILVELKVNVLNTASSN